MNTKTSRLIYLDYAATNPVDQRVATKMMNYLTFDGVFGNPASRSHGLGWQAEEAVENARMQIADAINANSLEIVFTSGATESDNLAIKGVAHAYAHKGKHIITSQIEHKAVLDTCKYLETQGFEVTYLAPEKNTGIISPAHVKEALRDDTILVSLMMVNNEIGTITDVASIGKITRDADVLFHVDAAQAFGKVSIDLGSNPESMPIDLMSFSAHKIYGPKGIGALYVRRQPKVEIGSEIHGGGHERGMRSGTLATHQIVGMGEAFELAIQDFDKDHQHIADLKHKFWAGLQDLQDIKAVSLNGSLNQSVPNVINVGFSCIEGQSLMMSLKDLAVSSGSACTSKTVEPSFVLKAIGIADEVAHSSIRFSFGRYTTEEDIEIALKQVHEAIEKLRDLSPLWKIGK